MTVTGQGLGERRQQRLLRSYGSHTLDAILIDPVQGISEATASCRDTTDHRIGDEPASRKESRSDGIAFGGEWGNPAELLTWTQVQRLAQSTPADLREEIRDLRLRWRQHSGAYRRFTASAAAVGCGPCPEFGPLTQRQAGYAEELPAWEASGVGAEWRATIAKERSLLHARVFPLACSDEPVDLLELLDQPPPPAMRPAIAPPTPGGRPVNEREAATPDRAIGMGRPS